MQAVHRLDRAAFENDSTAKAFHPQDADLPLQGLWDYQLRKASKVRIHDVDRHLHGVEVESVPVGDLEHVEVNARVLVPCEPDESHLARLLRLHHRFHRAALGEDPVGIIESNDLVMLQQVQVIHLQPFQRLVDLARGRFLGATVNLGHHESLLPVAALLQRLAHTYLAPALVVVPRVVEEVDAPVQRFMDQLDGVVFADRGLTKVRPAQPDRRHFHPGLSQGTEKHLPAQRAFLRHPGNACRRGFGSGF